MPDEKKTGWRIKKIPPSRSAVLSHSRMRQQRYLFCEQHFFHGRKFARRETIEIHP